jgi:hypothetical protein
MLSGIARKTHCGTSTVELRDQDSSDWVPGMVCTSVIPALWRLRPQAKKKAGTWWGTIKFRMYLGNNADRMY